MTHSPRQITDHIIRMAALHTPQQLKRKALVLITAFLFQHECLATELKAAQLEAVEDCDDPMAVIRDFQQMLHGVIADGTVLSLIHELLTHINADFQKASPSVIKAVVDHMHASLDDDEQRAFLERMLSHPTEPDERPT